MSKPRKITLRLVDGSAQGRIHAELYRSTAQVWVIPRSRLRDCIAEPGGGFDVPGIYLLIDSRARKKSLYIGKADWRRNRTAVIARLLDHDRNPEKKWDTAVLISSSRPGEHGNTENSYLEWSFHERATTADIATIVNRQLPSHGVSQEDEQALLDAFVDDAICILRSLGFTFFEIPGAPDKPGDDSQKRRVSRRRVGEPVPLTEEEQQSVEDSGLSPATLQDVFVLRSRHCDARGHLTEDGFIVLAGSVVRRREPIDCAPGIRKLRRRYARRLDSDRTTMIRDAEFSSPSAAAGFVRGSSTSGRLAWVRESDGVQLGQLVPRR